MNSACASARSFAEVERVLTEIGPPAAGTRRYYRGQVQGYLDASGQPSIAPQLARRRSHGYDPGWLVLMTQVLHTTMGMGSGVPVEFPTTWAPALIQHYGPGSHFVDVTSDLSVAMWFALHRYHERWISLMLGNRDALYPVWVPTAWYTARDASVQQRRSVLYVFDVPLWDGLAMPAFGSAVDLIESAIGGWVKECSRRMVVQRGALLHANAAFSGQRNVGSLLRAVIELDHEFDEVTVPGCDRSTSVLFPPPGEDPFYLLLLNLPFQVRFSPTRMQSPLAVPFYLSANPNVWQVAGTSIDGAGTEHEASSIDWNIVTSHSSWKEELDTVAGLSRWADPPLLHAALINGPRVAREMSMAAGLFALEDAVPILMESVLMKSTPPAIEGKQSAWIEAALPWGLIDEIDGRSTGNVFVELSASDYFELRSEEGKDVIRAIWVVRRHPEYFLRAFLQVDAQRPIDCRFHFDQAKGIFQSETRCPPALRKALFVVLALLKDANPEYKPPALSAAGFGAEGVDIWFHLPAGLLVGQRAFLERIAHGRFLVPRGEGQPYSLGVRAEGPWLPQDPALARASLERYLPLINNLSYLLEAAPVLAHFQQAAGAYPQLLQYTARSLNALRVLGEGTSVGSISELKLTLYLATAQAATGAVEAAKITLAGLFALSPKRAQNGPDVEWVLSEANTLALKLSHAGA